MKLQSFKVGDVIGVVTSGRRHDAAERLVVQRISAKRLTAGTEYRRKVFDLETGAEIGNRWRCTAYAVDDPVFVAAETAHAKRDADLVLQTNAAKRQRDERYGLTAAARGSEADYAKLDEIAREADRLAERLNARLSRVEPANLYRELGWLRQSAGDSARLSWLVGLLAQVRERPADCTVQTVLDDHKRTAENRLMSASLHSEESIAELEAAHEMRQLLTALDWRTSVGAE